MTFIVLVLTQTYILNNFILYFYTEVNVGSTGCSTLVTDSCKDVNAECKTNNGACTCKSNYYDDQNSNSDLRACKMRKLHSLFIQ